MKRRLRSTGARIIGMGMAPTLAIALALAVTVLSPIGAAAAQPSIRFDIFYGRTCFSGTSNAPAVLDIIWRDAAGSSKAVGTTDSNGYWIFCSGDNQMVIQIGDRIRVSDGNFTRKYVVPDLTLVSDRVSNTFHGTAPAGRTIRVSFFAGLFDDADEIHSVRVGQDGLWVYNPDFDILGGQYASLTWLSPKGDHLETSGIAPEIHATIGKSSVTGWVDPHIEMRLVLRDGTTGERKAVAAGISDQNGSPAVVFRDEIGQRVPVAVGDIVRGLALADDLDWIVPDIEAIANVDADVVSGVCGDEGLLTDLAFVEIYRTGMRRGFDYAHVEPDGHFNSDFRGHETLGFNPANIKHGDRVVVRCFLETGDQGVQSFLVP